jgi:hypothetical protein
MCIREYYHHLVNPVIDEMNRDLKHINTKIIVRHHHVIDRLIERNIPPVDVMTALNLMSEKLCQLVYYTKLDRPFYSFDIRTAYIILAVGFESGDDSRFIVRTVLDPEKHNKHSDEKHHIISFTK